MKTAIRKIGNSAGVIIPAEMLRKQGFVLGEEVELHESKAGIEIAATKPSYTLDELLDQCDLNAPMPQDLMDWDASQPVGNELL